MEQKRENDLKKKLQVLMKLFLLVCPGSGEEKAASATVFALLCIQLGGGDEAEEGFKMLRPPLTATLSDSSASIAARQSVSNHMKLVNVNADLDLGWPIRRGEGCFFIFCSNVICMI